MSFDRDQRTQLFAYKRLFGTVGALVGLWLGLNGVSLWLIGFSAASTTQTPEIGWHLALLFGPMVGILFFGAGLILWRLPLTDERQQRIQHLLRRRRQRRHIS